jgi:hypothetical protein
MEGITGILVFMGIGSILGLIVGNLLWHKDHKRIKLQEKLIDHYKGLSEYLEEKLNEKWRKDHDLMIKNLDDTFKELEKAANEWELETKEKLIEPTIHLVVETEQINKKYIVVLIQELENVLKEVKDVLENAPCKFQWLEYKKAHLVEPLLEALKQVVYFDHIEELKKED